MANSIFRKPVNNYREIQQKILTSLTDIGNSSTATLQSYPTLPGVYRVGSPTGIAGLPSGITGYGALIVGNAGSYCFHIYIDNNKSLYWGIITQAASSTSLITPPSKWRYVQGTEVNPAS